MKGLQTIRGNTGGVKNRDARPNYGMTADEVAAYQAKKAEGYHVHNWCPTDNWLIDRCSVCGEERA